VRGDRGKVFVLGSLIVVSTIWSVGERAKGEIPSIGETREPRERHLGWIVEFESRAEVLIYQEIASRDR
jgi:hypothetical protein